ncbi:MAG: OmpA family protein [Betaproteobacteria bacterium]|nr:OmpA family protein [Betaproteobacteria bacterium]
MTTTAPGRILFAAWLAAFAAFPATSQAADPSVEEMIEALAAGRRVPPAEGSRTRGLRPAQASATAVPREGRLQLTVQFDFASARISTDSREVLQRLATAMKSPALSGLSYRIEGHTDAVGDGAANIRLSERRAKAVLDFLQGASGVEASRLAAIGMGSAKPRDPDNPRAAVNRRVVVVSLEAAPAPVAAAKGPPEGAGTVERLQGQLQVRRGPSNSVLQVGSRVREGDVLTTSAEATALLRLDDGANLLLRANSVLRVAGLKLAGDPSGWKQAFELVVGAFRYLTGALGGNRPDAVAFSTSLATVGIRGTDIDVVHKPEAGGWGEVGTYVKVNKGAAAVDGVDGTRVELGRLEQAFAGERKPVMRGMAPAPAAVRLKEPAGVFETGALDGILEER